MNQYVTGTMIKRLRESRKMTQAQLAESLHVSDKAVSKWETGRGCPDIALIEQLAETLGVSVIGLLRLHRRAAHLEFHAALLDRKAKLKYNNICYSIARGMPCQRDQRRLKTP